MGLRTAVELAAAAAVLAWLAVALATVVGRAGYERRRRTGTLARSGAWSERRLVAHAASHRGEAGKWRRIAALRELARREHPRSRTLLRTAVRDRDRDVAGAAVKALGDRGDAWAVEQLVDALRRDRASRSRVAAQLERLTPAIGPRLVPLLEDLDPAVRFWAATLLGLCPEHGRAELVRHARDPEANVRAAVMEALGERGDRSAAPVVRALLGDAEWFVRLHACRSLGRLGETADAARVAPLLRDRNWWVRAAAKDALRGLGLPAVGALLPYLEDADAFARNGAAEVLQDIGLVDTIAAHGAGRDLLERILAAGGEGYRAAALVRADLAGHEERAQAG